MKLEELNMREYCMYALGASHAENFESYKKEFVEMFLSNPWQDEENQKEDKAEDDERK